MVATKNNCKLADLLAEMPDGFEITDEMRAWMNMKEVGKEVWWRDGETDAARLIMRDLVVGKGK